MKREREGGRETQRQTDRGVFPLSLNQNAHYKNVLKHSMSDGYMMSCGARRQYDLISIKMHWDLIISQPV